MILNASTLEAIQLGFQAIFYDALKGANPIWPKVAMRTASNSKTEVYPWLGAAPVMEEWLDERSLANIKAYKWTIENKDWANGIEVDRNDIQDDKIGIYNPMVQSLGYAAAIHPDKLIFQDLLLNGFSTTCYDGQYFFDTDHPRMDGLSVQSNKHSLTLTADNYATVRATMMALTDDRGNPLGVMPNLLVVPPQLEQTALEIVKADRNSSGATNVLKGSADVLVAPYLASQPTWWFLLDTTKPVKPFILQVRQEAQIVSQTNPDSDNVFMRKKFRYGADWRGAAAYGLWQFAAGSQG